MNHATLSSALALALGYHPESVRMQPKGGTYRTNTGNIEWRTDISDYCAVYRVAHDTPGYAVTMWMKFDYRDPGVCLPLIKWLLPKGIFFTQDPVFPHWTMARGVPSEMDRSYSTLEEAVARAVIAVKEG